jgi:uncharacterized protein (DUF885 family)
MNDNLTRLQAYKAMYVYLDKIWQRNYTKGIVKGPGDLPSLLGSMSLLPDGSTADSAYMQDWDEAIESLENLDISPNQATLTGESITQNQAYLGMHCFIEKISVETNSSELLAILSDLRKSKDSGNKDDCLISTWQSAIDDAINNDPDIRLNFV